MGIKDLFNDYKSNQFKGSENQLSASKLVESNEFIENKFIEKYKYVPPIDFSTASNFAKFGSSELYYEYAFKRIYQQYPYDGSLAEKEEFHNNSTFLDKYIFDFVYPKTTGHVIFSSDGWGTQQSSVDGYGLSDDSQYISVLGGPHTASGGMEGKELTNTFDNSMIYDTSKSRVGSFEWNPTSGSTIEFWMKKDQFITSSTEKEVILDIWNGEESGSTSYGRIRLELTGASNGVGPLRLTMISGTTGFQWQDICPSTLTTASIADDTWHHYAVSFNSSTDTTITLYRDGRYLQETTVSSTNIGDIKNVSGGVNAYIGALQTTPSGSTAAQYAGKLSASLDEFRFWKKQRTTNEIGEFWFTTLGGGTNKREYNTDLGVYFKFNEGITGDSDIDQSVLDYSGRISNGVFAGYTGSARSTISAMETLTNVEEPKDPIIYSSHPTVSSSLATYKTTGSIQDYENTSLLYNLFPSWIVEEDAENGKNLKYLTQIMASYFDTLNAQINGVTEFKAKRYFSGSLKPNTYAREVLRGQGFVIPELFIEADILEEMRGKDNNETYDEDIQKIKNLIYNNIYNNLNYIYKSKGTEKSFRNFFRCFGADSELIKLNLYSDNSTYLYKDNYEFTSLAKPVVNFNKEEHLEASVYMSSSGGLTYLSSSEGNDEQYTSMTMEVEVLFPYKFEKYETGYFPTPFTTASIAGFHRALTSSADDFTWHSSDTDLRIYALKQEIDSKHVRFLLTGSGVEITSSQYQNVYDNNKWILAARVKHSKYPFAGFNVTGATAGDYTVEFYGVNSVGNDIKNEFSLSQDVNNTLGKNLLGHAKRIYAGAHRENFTGSTTLQETDVKISQVRFWQSHLSNNEIKEHSYDPTNYGLIHPYRSDAIFQVSGSEQVYVPQIETLALHWDYMTVSSSDSGGNFIVSDISSGSTSETSKYSMIGKITKNKYDGYGIGFVTSSTDAVDKEFFYTAKKRLPDEVYSSDGVVIKTNETENFFQDDAVADHFYAFEKSPYNAVSQQMINFFGSMKDFNSLVGDPAERYRFQYKQLEDLKRLFFEKVENVPDPERFFEYFKWIDTSISYAISQLIPAGSRFAEDVRDIVESHILERNKYQEKFPLLAQQTATEGVVKSFSELSYNWKFGHAPVDGSDNKHCLWQKIRRRISDTNVQNLRDNIYKTGNTKLDRLYDIVTEQVYEGNTDAIRRLNRPYKINLELKQNIHGGTNYYVAKNRDYLLDIVHPHGETTADGIPKNVLVAGVGVGQGLIPQTICEDEEGPLYKEKYKFDGVDGRFSSNQTNAPLSDFDSYKNFTKGIATFPFNIMSQSNAVSTGYQATVTSKFKDSAYITNLHSDTTDRTNTIPMQGPFTEKHVGGHQSRHVRLNKYDTTLFDADYGGAPRFYRTISGTKSNGTLTVTTASVSDGDSISISDGTNTVVFEIDSANDGLVTGSATSVLTGATITTFANNFSSSISSSALSFSSVDVTINASNFVLVFTASATGSSGLSFSGGGSGMAGVVTTGTTASSQAFFRYIDNLYTRPEAWRLLFGENPNEAIVDGALGFTPPDYGVTAGTGIYPDTAKHRASFYREEKAKRPVNVRNIKHDANGNSIGNYLNNYEIMMLQGRKENNLYLRDNPAISNYLPPQYTSSLPHTTHVMGLYGIDPTTNGNVFGVHVNNMQPDGQEIIAATLGTEADGRFTVKESTNNGTIAQGSFRVKSRDFVTDGDKVTIVRTSPSDTNEFFVNTGGPHNVSTGSSISGFYNNLRTSIRTNSVYNDTSYSATAPTYGVGVWNNDVRFDTFLSGTFSGNHWGSPASGAWSCAFWIYVSSSNSDEGNIYTEEASGLPGKIRRLYLKSNNELVYERYYTTTTPGTNLTASWSGSIDLDQWTHVIITQGPQGANTGASAIPSTVKFSINSNQSGDTISAATSSGPDAINGTPTPSGVFYFFSDTNVKALTCGLDEVGLWNVDLGGDQQNAANLYNNGLYAARTVVSSSNLKAWWRFGDDGYIVSQNAAYDLDATRTLTNNDILHEQQDNQHVTASENSTELYLVDSIYETTGYADFTVKNAGTGSSFNGTISETGDSFSNTSNITGGTDESGATDGDTIVIDNGSGTAITFELDNDSSVTSTATLRGIDCSDGVSNSDFWNALSQSIKDYTVYDTITITDNGTTALFELTSSTTGSSLNVTMTETGNSFTSLVGIQNGTDPTPATYGTDVVLEISRSVLANNERNRAVIATRFAAPGGVEIECPGYLDVYAREYSVYNALPFRNLTVRGSGSGESGTIRVVDHLGKRRGLNTLLSLHCGQFGIDSQYGSISESTYSTSGSFHKQHRNRSRRMEYSGLTTVTGSVFDNAFVSSPIPRSELQYAWINNIVSGSDAPTQRILGYQNPNGFVSSSAGYVESIVFPSSSNIT